LTRSDHLDHVGARLALDVEDDRRDVVHPGGEAHVLGVVDDVGHVREGDRRAVLVGDDDALVLGRERSWSLASML
jgi:hypothetical protein